jgi:hypothetical protein
MFGLLEDLMALVGLLALVGVALFAWALAEGPEPATESDDIYRDALAAGARMSAAAYEAEQAMLRAACEYERRP